MLHGRARPSRLAKRRATTSPPCPIRRRSARARRRARWRPGITTTMRWACTGRRSLKACDRMRVARYEDEDVWQRGGGRSTRDLKVRDVSVRQEFSVQAGSRHLFETGFDVHALRTGWGWTVGADMTEDLSRAMRFAVTGDPGPTRRRIGPGTASAPALDQRHHPCRGLVPGSLPAARRCAPRTRPADRSQRPRGRDDRVSAARHAPGPDASDAAALCDRALHAEPRLRETPAVGLLRRPDVRRQRPDQERAIRCT